jgi:hypothetical protein
MSYQISKQGQVDESFGLGDYQDAIEFIAALYDVDSASLWIDASDPDHVGVTIVHSNNEWLPAPSEYTIDLHSEPEYGEDDDARHRYFKHYYSPVG